MHQVRGNHRSYRAPDCTVIDNFSSGTRGSVSAELLLQHGYRVIFLHRRFSFQPFLRVLKHTRHDLFSDFEPVSEGGQEGSKRVLQLTVTPWVRNVFRVAQRAFLKAKVELRLLLVEFTTIQEYLWLLRMFSGILGRFGPRSMGYYAAAVSDFYIPRPMMPKHKISGRNLPSLHHSPAVHVLGSNPDLLSIPVKPTFDALDADSSPSHPRVSSEDVLSDSDSVSPSDISPSPSPVPIGTKDAVPGRGRYLFGGMTERPAVILRLFHVPKILWHSSVVWPGQNEHIFSVSFKLETNSSVLMPHAKRSMSRYDLSVTIANLLQEHRKA